MRRGARQTKLSHTLIFLCANRALSAQTALFLLKLCETGLNALTKDARCRRPSFL